jgi:hypothetical protein
MNRYFHFHGQLSNFEIVCLSPSEQKGKLRAGLVTQKGKQTFVRFSFSVFPFSVVSFPSLLQVEPVSQIL